jgi:hypothetical protein
MANVNLTTRQIVEEGLSKVFDEVYSQHGHIEYRLEQCGKLYRVKKTLWGNNFRPEYKTGWLKLKEAQAILKLMEVSEDGTA